MKESWGEYIVYIVIILASVAMFWIANRRGR
jgi:hypothetical protein